MTMTIRVGRNGTAVSPVVAQAGWPGTSSAKGCYLSISVDAECKDKSPRSFSSIRNGTSTPLGDRQGTDNLATAVSTPP